MEKDHFAIIRIQPAQARKLYPGHVGITMLDDQGDQKHFDYGSVLAGGGYSKAASSFAKAASYASFIGVYVAYGLMGHASGDDLFNALNIKSIHSDGLATTASMAYASAFGVTSAGVLSETGEREAKQGEKTIKIPLTREQYGKLVEKVATPSSSLYSIALSNCATHIKHSLRAAGIDLDRRVLNTPRTIEKDIKRALPEIEVT